MRHNDWKRMAVLLDPGGIRSKILDPEDHTNQVHMAFADLLNKWRLFGSLLSWVKSPRRHPARGLYCLVFELHLALCTYCIEHLVADLY